MSGGLQCCEERGFLESEAVKDQPLTYWQGFNCSQCSSWSWLCLVVQLKSWNKLLPRQSCCLDEAALTELGGFPGKEVAELCVNEGLGDVKFARTESRFDQLAAEAGLVCLQGEH